MRLWPRSIRWQLLTGLLLLEALSIGLFAALLVHQQERRIYLRARQTLAYQVTSLAVQSAEALGQDRTEWVQFYVKMMVNSPTVEATKISDLSGGILFSSSSKGEQTQLRPDERAQIALMRSDEPRVFTGPDNRWEAVHAIYTGDRLRGYAWVTFDRNMARQEIRSLLSDLSIFGVIWLLASAALMLLVGRAMARPLAMLHRGTRALMAAPESSGGFPLPVTVRNEFGDLIEAFNGMVASIAEQRAGLNDTLSLLDSMQANAPIGLAFLDRRYRFVRVNQVFAGMTGVPLSRHLGRTLSELLPSDAAQKLEETVAQVFTSEQPARNLELSGQDSKPGQSWTWLASAYPVLTSPQQVRWVGVIVLDASERKRSEEALRKTEKLAATGRLAASIAHEINNPLEAITNLLFLLRNFCSLEGPAMEYVTLAEHEARRISEITQQTLRFYRQSTMPSRASMSELLDSVLSLHQGRLSSLNLQVERKYERETDLFCFAGELRQVFANLIGNAIDATPSGGRILVRAHRSRNWKQPDQTGIRFAFADTGTGMDAEVRAHAFEAFFTTKEVTGTGLGLWVSHEIIVKHRGIVHVRSTPAGSGKPSGTVFQLFIPDNENLPAAGLPARTADTEDLSKEQIALSDS
ncbi:MAG TPA: ATP-binding protein [Terracidiphilus sp.]|nr:ATP-binding protein [Terracidiphilus sp.]